MFDTASKNRSDIPTRFDSLLAGIRGDSLQLRKIGTGEPCPWEDAPEAWLTHLFPEAVFSGFGDHHREIWDWAWSIKRRTRPQPFVAIWPRGGGKSTNSELVCIATGALQLRRYALYVSATQPLADKHVSDIARRLESEAIERYYPALAAREVSKYGISRGWSGSRLRTAAGFMVDAIGLDAAVRGLKVGDYRPDIIILDDVDHLSDSLTTVDDKIATITQSILPAGSTDVAVLAVQNLIHPDSIFSRLAGVSEHSIDMLADRVVSGPHPAIIDMVTEQQGNRTVITGGTPLWAGQGIKECQDAIDTYGISAFSRESQQEVESPAGGMFDSITFRHCRPEQVPDLVRVEVWVDPAVTDTDQSDAHGVQVDGVDSNGTLYRLWSWEQRASPETALRTAILKAIEYGATTIGVETNQGGDLWKMLYPRIVGDLKAEGAIAPDTRIPGFREEKSSSSTGSKAARVGQMLVDYERDRIIHVIGTHQVLERALKRFPLTKPLDLADVCYWGWKSLIGPDLPYAYLRNDPEVGAILAGNASPLPPHDPVGDAVSPLTDADRIEQRRRAYYASLGDEGSP